MALPERMRFGIFLAPFHRYPDNPTLAIEREESDGAVDPSLN